MRLIWVDREKVRLCWATFHGDPTPAQVAEAIVKLRPSGKMFICE